MVSGTVAKFVLIVVSHPWGRHERRRTITRLPSPASMRGQQGERRQNFGGHCRNAAIITVRDLIRSRLYPTQNWRDHDADGLALALETETATARLGPPRQTWLSEGSWAKVGMLAPQPGWPLARHGCVVTWSNMARHDCSVATAWPRWLFCHEAPVVRFCPKAGVRN